MLAGCRCCDNSSLSIREQRGRARSHRAELMSYFTGSCVSDAVQKAQTVKQQWRKYHRTESCRAISHCGEITNTARGATVHAVGLLRRIAIFCIMRALEPRWLEGTLSCFEARIPNLSLKIKDFERKFEDDKVRLQLCRLRVGIKW